MGNGDVGYQNEIKGEEKQVCESSIKSWQDLKDNVEYGKELEHYTKLIVGNIQAYHDVDATPYNKQINFSSTQNTLIWLFTIRSFKIKSIYRN